MIIRPTAAFVVAESVFLPTSLYSALLVPFESLQLQLPNLAHDDGGPGHCVNCKQTNYYCLDGQRLCGSDVCTSSLNDTCAIPSTDDLLGSKQLR